MSEKPFLSTKGMSYQQMYRALRDDAFYHPDLALRGWAAELHEVGRQAGLQEAEDAYSGSLSPEARARRDAALADPMLLLGVIESLIQQQRGAPTTPRSELARPRETPEAGR